MIHTSLRGTLVLAVTVIVTASFAGVAPAEPTPPPGKAIITEERPAIPSGVAIPSARQGEVTPEQAFEWDGTIAPGANTMFDAASATPCNQVPSATGQCDVTLLNVNVP